MEKSNHNDMIICPYNSKHRLLRAHLSTHLIRCSKNHKDMEMVHCPFNITHVVKKDELKDHILCCKSAEECRVNRVLVELVRPPLRRILEAPPPVHNPDNGSIENLIGRNALGKSRVVRRKFLENKRLRSIQ